MLSVVPDPRAVVTETERILRDEGHVSNYDKFVPDESTPSVVRRLVNPIARLLFADLNRSLELILGESGLSNGGREDFLGRVYIVAVA